MKNVNTFAAIVSAAEKAALVFGGKVNPCRQTPEWAELGDAIEASLGSNAPVDEVFWSLIQEYKGLLDELAPIEEAYEEALFDGEVNEETEAAYEVASARVEECNGRMRSYLMQWHEGLPHILDDIHLR